MEGGRVAFAPSGLTLGSVRHAPPFRAHVSRIQPRLRAASTTTIRMASVSPPPDPAPDLVLPDPPKPLEFKFMPLRWIRKFVKVYLLGGLTVYGMFAVNTIVSVLFIFLKPWLRKVVLAPFGGYVTAYSMTPALELDFDYRRMLSYFPHLIAADDRFTSVRFGMRTANELIGGQRLPTDAEFISQILQRTPLAFYCDNTPTHLDLKIPGINDATTFPNTYYDATRVTVDKATSEITMYVTGGPPEGITRAKDGDFAFERAKFHAMTTMSIFVPGIGHSWVHFYFPDCVSAVVHNDLDRRSVLYSLLAPHTRFTSRINWEALAVRGNLVWGTSALVRMAGEASGSVPRGTDAKGVLKVFEPFTPFQVTGDEFVRKNVERTTAYYLYTDEFGTPPKWFEGDNTDIPYIRALKRYWPVIRNHVAEVLKYEDMETVKTFLAKVEEVSQTKDDGIRKHTGLRLKDADPIDAIASLIFDVAVVHSTDHYLFFKLFQTARFGNGALRHPYERDWFPGKVVPDDMCDDLDRVTFYNFADIFVNFNDDVIFSNSMENLKYHFKPKELRTRDKEFIEELRALQSEMERNGDPFCPLNKMAISICF